MLQKLEEYFLFQAYKPSTMIKKYWDTSSKLTRAVANLLNALWSLLLAQL